LRRFWFKDLSKNKDCIIFWVGHLSRSVRYEKMNKDSRKISSGPFKGKKIELVHTTGVDKFLKISDVFMKKILDLFPGDYLISD